VLSQSTEGYDRGEKFDYYRECPTIQEYVLVRTQQQAVEIYRRSTGKLWVFVPCGPGDQVELTSLNVTIPIERFYEGVSFPEQPIS
jgi:Uma2 family endonuclease